MQNPDRRFNSLAPRGANLDFSFDIYSFNNRFNSLAPRGANQQEYR